MLRRIFLTAALAACTAIPVWAQTRATYVLSNGEKHNGVIVYGRGDNNIVDDKFHLNKSGVELVFEHADVAVIDFVGGTAANAELQALPNEGELMVMRDGSVQRGHLHNILKPDLVQWVNEGGQRNNYPIGEVRRLYLNPRVARTVFFGGSQPTSGAVAQTRNVFGRNNSTAVRVDANQQWVDSGVDVRRGDRVALTATGEIEYGPGARATAAGTRGGGTNYPLPTMGAGGLIARVGDSAPFAVGAGSHTITMPADGRLMFGVNDDNVSDNTGSFGVTVRKQ